MSLLSASGAAIDTILSGWLVGKGIFSCTVVMWVHGFIAKLSSPIMYNYVRDECNNIVIDQPVVCSLCLSHSNFRGQTRHGNLRITNI